MKFSRLWLIGIFLWLTFENVLGQMNLGNNTKAFKEEECTIGVAAGKATSDGRPMLWKTRDYLSSPNNEVKYDTSFRYKFISVSNAGSSTYAWMGLNEHGFAIVNALSTDLPKGSSGPSNGAFMRDVLGNCKTVAEFRHYLDSTNRTGRETRANFGVIDSTGEAAIFETSGNQYWEFNANNSPNGYVIRTNFSMTGGGSTGIERYNRSADLMAKFYAGDSLNLKSILRYQMRDFSDFNSNPVSVPYKQQWAPGIPYGYINTSKSICRYSSVSAAVIHGVLPTEKAGLSTMWTILGQPASSVALPYWPVVNTPPEADGETTAPLCDISRQIRSTLFTYNADDEFINSFKLRDGKGGGLWSYTFPFEDSVFSVTTLFMDSLRSHDNLPLNALRDKEENLARRALARLNYYRSLLLGIHEEKVDSLQIYPNPVGNGPLYIRYSLSGKSRVSIELYSVLGQKLMRIDKGVQYPGSYLFQLPLQKIQHSGIYWIIVTEDQFRQAYKVVIL